MAKKNYKELPLANVTFPGEIALKEGQKVKLNLARIQEQVNAKPIAFNKVYVRWCNKNAKKVFTVQYDKKIGPVCSLHTLSRTVCLLEDKTEPKWLFHYSDLILLEEEQEEK